ncbi:uncharacterized protein LOC113359425 [Papaver somniferum]|uniref:uncharacterized protein LOC113359425 n=1 Tax=Papaver somniferum TaxID=3469 RepID=UPI000E6F77BA|nr:uncharacterized protein LOC113359425 [Papaver somniferum]
MSWQKNESDVENRDPNYNRLVDGSGSDVEMEEKMPESKISSRGSSEEENSNVEDAFRNPKSGHQKSKKSRRCNSRVPSSSRYLRAKQRILFHVRSNSSSFGGFHPSGSRRLDLRGGTTAIGIKLRTCAILATDGNETVDDVIVGESTNNEGFHN